MTQILSFPTTPNDFKIWESIIGTNGKEYCSQCDGKLDTFYKGHKLHKKIYICYQCDTVFENQKGKLIKSERFTVI